MKLTVCLEMFFKDLPFAERVAKVKAAGYDAGEFWKHDNKDIPALAAACAENNFAITSLGGLTSCLNDPAKHEQLIPELDAAIVAAKALSCARVIALSGDTLRNVTRAAQCAAIVAGLKKLAPIAESGGVTIVLEMLNSTHNHPGYFLDNTLEMALILRAVDHPNVKALFDVYHAGVMEGNVIEKIRDDIALIGHFHAAGIPGRNEMKAGEQNYPAICRAIDKTGFNGYLGLEYAPLKDPHESLVETREWLSGA